MVRALQFYAVLATHMAYWQCSMQYVDAAFGDLLFVAFAGCHDQVEGVTAAGTCT